MLGRPDRLGGLWRTMRCGNCKSVLGEMLGSYFATSWNHRKYILYGVTVVDCDQCRTQLIVPDISAGEAADEFRRLRASQIAPILCQTPGCGRTLGQVGTVGAPIAFIDFRKRRILCESINHVTCDHCRESHENPTVSEPVSIPPRPRRRWTPGGDLLPV